MSVYYCTINHIATYSQFPCGDDQTLLQINSDQQNLMFSPSTLSNDPDNSATTFQLNKRIERYQNKIALYKKRMKNELTALREKSLAGRSHSTPPSYHLAIKDEMITVKEKYTKLIGELSEQIVKTEQKKSDVE